MQIIHFDCKPQNVLLMSTAGAKLADVGLAKTTQGSKTLAFHVRARRRPVRAHQARIRLRACFCMSLHSQCAGAGSRARAGTQVCMFAIAAEHRVLVPGLHVPTPHMHAPHARKSTPATARHAGLHGPGTLLGWYRELCSGHLQARVRSRLIECVLRLFVGTQ